MLKYIFNIFHAFFASSSSTTLPRNPISVSTIYVCYLNHLSLLICSGSSPTFIHFFLFSVNMKKIEADLHSFELNRQLIALFFIGYIKLWLHHKKYNIFSPKWSIYQYDSPSGGFYFLPIRKEPSDSLSIHYIKIK